METTAQTGSNSDDGGGGGGRLLHALRDSGRAHLPPQAQDGPLDTGVNPCPQPLVLSLDQIQLTKSSNEYTEGPTVAPRPPALLPRQEKTELGTPPNEQPLENHELGPNQRNLLPQHSAQLYRDTLTHSCGVKDTSGSIRSSTGSTTSGQRLLGRPGAGKRIIRAQPQRVELKQEELKPLAPVSGGVTTTAGNALLGKHAYRCEDCGRCKCRECTRPRQLPSCWTCCGRCVCSAQSAVEYCTCVCCVKALFYHCSSDDEDTCADKPFSFTQAHCCARWSAVGFLSLLLPCLLCYLPANGCLTLSQSCYDRVKRPGCRCKNTNVVHCKSVDNPT
ncbi:protein sprouty homolog 2 [Aplochiton taeniatus]